jgi:hypothetical protein
MSDIILNGTTYSGTPNSPGTPAKPTSIERELRKFGRLLEAADGSTSWVRRSEKWKFRIVWGPRASVATKTAVRAIRNLTTTFTYVDEEGVSFTVLNVGDDEYTEVVKTDKSNTYQYELELILRQA